MDSLVPRLQAEPAIASPRATPRAPERRQREERRQQGGEGHFPLDQPPAAATVPHAEPHSPKLEGLGEKLDVIA